jgi:hypothetical protein
MVLLKRRVLHETLHGLAAFVETDLGRVRLYSSRRLLLKLNRRNLNIIEWLARIMQRFDGYTGRGGSIA